MEDKKLIPTQNGANAATAVAPTNGQGGGVKRVGCAHYKRRAQFVTPCCNKFYMCRYCHDENETHFFNRKTVTELICTECNTRQRVQAECEKCGVRFGRYTCLVCNLFDDEDRNQYHCDGCGICRVGGRGRFFHCEVCNMCLPLQLKYDGHRCVENVSRSNCPVCLDDIHTSRIPCHIPDCGHLLHRTCFEELLSSGHYACPTCQTSMMDMIQLWEYLDAEVAATPMPKEYENYCVDILCKDCHKESTVKFHVVGLKCTHCGAYNTCRTKTKAIDGMNGCGSGATTDGGMGSGTTNNSTSSNTTMMPGAPSLLAAYVDGQGTEGSATTLRLDGTTRHNTNSESSSRHPMVNGGGGGGGGGIGGGGGPSTSTTSTSSSSSSSSSSTSSSSSSSSSTASSSSTVVSNTGGSLGGISGLVVPNATSNGFSYSTRSSSSSSSRSHSHNAPGSSSSSSSSGSSSTSLRTNGHSIGDGASAESGAAAGGSSPPSSSSSATPPICDEDPRSASYGSSNSSNESASHHQI